MRHILIVALSLSTLACGVARTSTEISAPGLGEYVAGTIRQDSSGSWNVLVDAGHTSSGISHIEVDDGTLIVHYTFNALKVVSLIVTPDESYAAQGYTFGASVGLDFAQIEVYKATLVSGQIVQVKQDAGQVLGSSLSNIWLLGIMQK